MAKDDTGISRMTQEGEQLRVQGVFEGRPSDYKITLEQVHEYRKVNGETETQAMLHRGLRGGVAGLKTDERP